MPFRQHWLTSEPSVSSNLCVPSTGFTDGDTRFGFLYGTQVLMLTHQILYQLNLPSLSPHRLLKPLLEQGTATFRSLVFRTCAIVPVPRYSTWRAGARPHFSGSTHLNPGVVVRSCQLLTFPNKYAGHVCAFNLISEYEVAVWGEKC